VSHEIEAAAAGSLGGFLRWRRKAEHALPIGTPCPNCATPLQGPWCFACGQLGEDFHRSIWRLIAEACEGLLHFDGRVWKTLPDLMLRPWRLTTAYLEGHRAPQIPPLRLFLVMLVILFICGSIGGGRGAVQTITTDDHGKVIHVTTTSLEHMDTQQQAAFRKLINNPDAPVGKPGAARSWLRGHLSKAVDDPARFRMALEQWAERFAFLTLPLAAGLLSLLFLFQRRFYVFDHTIFSLHSLSAVGLIQSVVFLLRVPLAHFGDVLLLAMPVHLFVHMRGVYRTSIIGTLIRMALLGVGTLIGFGAIVLGLVMVALNTLGG
jgi:hypothetical protein